MNYRVHFYHPLVTIASPFFCQNNALNVKTIIELNENVNIKRYLKYFSIEIYKNV